VVQFFFFGLVNLITTIIKIKKTRNINVDAIIPQFKLDKAIALKIFIILGVFIQIYKKYLKIILCLFYLNKPNKTTTFATS